MGVIALQKCYCFHITFVAFIPNIIIIIIIRTSLMQLHMTQTCEQIISNDAQYVGKLFQSNAFSFTKKTHCFLGKMEKGK